MSEIIVVEVMAKLKNETEPGLSQVNQKLGAMRQSAEAGQKALKRLGQSAGKEQKALDAMGQSAKDGQGTFHHLRQAAGTAGSGIDGTREAVSRYDETVGRSEKRTKGFMKTLRDFAGEKFSFLLDVSGNYEQTETAFASLLKSEEKAKKFMSEAAAFSSKTPFEFPELLESSRLLMTYGIEAGKVLDILKTVGDASSGLGAGTEEVGSITKVFGQMWAKGQAGPEELSQLQELGIPAARILQEELGLTAGQMAELGKQGIQSSDAIDALLRGMGKEFGGSMQEQAKTAKGMLETIRETMENTFLLKWGAGLWDGFKPALERITSWLDSNQDTVRKWAAAWEQAGKQFSHMVVDGLDWIRETMAEVMKTPEWEEADFFGKVSLSWNALIAEPFLEWWNGSGREMAEEALHSIGKGLGTGISMTLCALLGIDMSNVVGEGQNIGGAFMGGLIEGLSRADLKGVFAGAAKGLFKSAGKLLPGGEKADLSSILSAALIGKVASVGIKGIKGVKALFSGPGAAGATGTAGETGMVWGAKTAGLGKQALGSAAAGTGILGGGATAAIELGAGNLAGGASLSAGMLSATGLGAVTMGAIGAGVTLDGIGDMYKGSRSENEDESRTYKESGWMKAGGVGGGAMAGAIIGSVVPIIGPIVGSLIGAGLGGIVGKLKGDEHIGEYEEAVREAQKTAETAALKEEKAFLSTGKSVDKVKFSTRELNKAFNDSEVSAEEFNKMFQRAVDEDMERHFGNIHLNMEEINRLAKDFVLADHEEGMVRFQMAAQEAEKSLSSLQDSERNLDKMEWKAGIGIELSKNEKSTYKDELDNYIAGAEQYVQDDYYSQYTASSLLLDGENGVKFDDNINGEQKEKLKALKEKGEEMKALAGAGDYNGAREAREEMMVIAGANKERDPMARIGQLEEKGLGGMDQESFSGFAAEGAVQMRYAKKTYKAALEEGLANSSTEEERQMWTEAYNRKMQEAEDSLMNGLFGGVASIYDDKLSTVFSEGADITQVLRDKVYGALEAGQDVSKWQPNDVASWLGLEGLDDITLEAIQESIQDIVPAIPQMFEDGLNESEGVFPVEALMKSFLASGITGNSLAPLLTPLISSLFGEGGNLDFSESDSGLGAGLEEIMSDFQQAMETTGLETGNSVPADVCEGIRANLEILTEGCSQIRNSVDTHLRDAFSKSFAIPTKIKLKFDLFLEGPSGAEETKPKPHTNPLTDAMGGFVAGKQLSWVGEEGPEAIIPLVPSRRERAIDLYEQTGKILGLGIYAEGGFGGATAGIHPDSHGPDNKVIRLFPEGTEKESPLAYLGESERKKSDNGVPFETESDDGNVKVAVTVQLTPQFAIEATDRGDREIQQMLKSGMREIADDMAVELAAKVEEAFQNMPVKGAS